MHELRGSTSPVVHTNVYKSAADPIGQVFEATPLSIVVLVSVCHIFDRQCAHTLFVDGILVKLAMRKLYDT